MEQNNNQLTTTRQVELVKTVFETALSDFPIMQQKSQRAVAALSMVKEVVDDESDTIANNLISKGKITYDAVVEMRMEITRKTDELKKELMQPEKAIDSEVERIRALRNKYANELAARAAQKQRELEKEKNKNDEIANVTARIKTNIVDGMYNAINTMSESIINYINSMNLDNWEAKMNKFNIKPSLKEDMYNSFFNVPYNQELLSPVEFSAIVNSVKEERTYEIVNAEYQRVAVGTVDNWKKTLPGKKAELERLRELSKTDPGSAAAQAEQVKQNEQALIDKNNSEAESSKQAALLQVQQQKDEQVINNDFKAQAALQEMPAPAKGATIVRRAVINCQDSEIVKVWSKIMLACYSNPKFKGHLKRDKKGAILPPDENGIPIYEDWAQALLNFVAKEHGGEIPGVEFKEIVSTRISK